MRLPKFEYLEVKTVKELVQALDLEQEGTVLLAGGTDLLVNMKYGLINPKRVINIKNIREFGRFTFGQDGLNIGSTIPLRQLSSFEVVREKFPAIRQVAEEEIGAYAHQVMGTIGGNLCQGNRCRYYNRSAFWRSLRPSCYKAGGNFCHVLKKSETCCSTYFGDMAPLLIALDSQIKLVGSNGERTLPLKDLYTNNGKDPLSLKRSEVLKEIIVPNCDGETVFLKLRVRNSLEFSILSLAVYLEKSVNGEIKKARIVYSGVGCGPTEALETEKALEGLVLNDQMIEGTSDQVAKEITPMPTSVTSPAYKIKMAKVLLKEALRSIP